MGTEAYKPPTDAQLSGQDGDLVSRAYVAHYNESPAAPSATGVLAAVTDDGTEQTITSGFTNPDVPRSVTATSGGTAADIGAIQVVVTGTNAAGETISETLPVFTANSATTVEGSKAFATVTQVVIPAHDGTAATTSIGTGSKLGLAHKLQSNSVFPGMTEFNGSLEGTDPTVTTDEANLEGNTADLNSTLDGSEIHLYYIAPADG